MWPPRLSPRQSAHCRAKMMAGQTQETMGTAATSWRQQQASSSTLECADAPAGGHNPGSSRSHLVQRGRVVVMRLVGRLRRQRATIADVCYMHRSRSPTQLRGHRRQGRGRTCRAMDIPRKSTRHRLQHRHTSACMLLCQEGQAHAFCTSSCSFSISSL